jgi:hypothetical protein
MELLIKGSDNKIKRLAKEIKLRVKRDGLDMSLKQKKKAKQIKVVEPEIVKPKNEKPKTGSPDKKGKKGWFNKK